MFIISGCETPGPGGICPVCNCTNATIEPVIIPDPIYMFGNFEGNCTCEYRLQNTTPYEFNNYCYNNSISYTGVFYNNVPFIKESCINGKERNLSLKGKQ